jgi:bifunctional non-homologous end joining protein LigD
MACAVRPDEVVLTRGSDEPDARSLTASGADQSRSRQAEAVAGETPHERLARYRSMRDFEATPEPPGAGDDEGTPANRFVIQQHDATRLHWDLRLEHDGVLASWALPRGVPWSPRVNRLAVHTEDHPLGYLDFEGDIPDGSYGAGHMFVWDRGTYEIEKWEDRKRNVVLHGAKVDGKFALFATRGRDWMIHRMDPPEDVTREPVPDDLRPMRSTASPHGATAAFDEDVEWVVELLWRGERALVTTEPGDVRVHAADGREITAALPDVRRLGRATGSLEAVLDGVLAEVDPDGRPTGAQAGLAERLVEASPSTWRRLAQKHPVAFLAFDLLWLEGHAVTELPWSERRALLEEIDLSGPAWQTPAVHHGDPAPIIGAASGNGLPGVVLKNVQSTYQPGAVTDQWLEVRFTS